MLVKQVKNELMLANNYLHYKQNEHLVILESTCNFGKIITIDLLDDQVLDNNNNNNNLF